MVPSSAKAVELAATALLRRIALEVRGSCEGPVADSRALRREKGTETIQRLITPSPGRKRSGLFDVPLIRFACGDVEVAELTPGDLGRRRDLAAAWVALASPR